MMRRCLPFVVVMFAASSALAAEGLTVEARRVVDPKPVFATVESIDVASARARIGGTIVELMVDEGSAVERGQVIASVGDDKLALQSGALDAQIAAAASQQAKAQEDFVRAQDLLRNGTIAKARFDEMKTAADVANNQLKARQAERAVIRQQMAEGQVLAPAPGRVLEVPVTKGSVIMPGEVVARIAADSYILRLELPERHAQALKIGDAVQLGEGKEVATGTIRQVYPEIVGGRVKADAEVPQLGGYFVGQRVRVWVNTDQRRSFVIPSSYIRTRAGIDYVKLQQGKGSALEVPVQRGAVRALEGMPDGVEILSGLHEGDVLLPSGE